MKQIYDRQFYQYLKNSSQKSAREIVPLILQLVQPKSVVDIGCGIGAWLSVFREFGVEQILGVDGDWVNPEFLAIPQDDFVISDLKQPLVIDQKFDLVVSLEVAEHLPPDCAKTFVESIVKLGEVILFSAAIPSQGGINHVNEQWPDYWIELFAEQGYTVIDCLRRQVWNNENVNVWFAQNMFMFVNQDYLDSYPLLKATCETVNSEPLRLVHPKYYLRKCSEIEQLKQELENTINLVNPKISLLKVLTTLPALATDRLLKRLNKS